MSLPDVKVTAVTTRTRPARARSAKSLAAEAAFRDRLAELGATPLYEKYLGKDHPHHVRCAAGHDCAPRPGSIRNGRQGICLTCAGHDPVVAEVAFRARLTELGATMLGDYVNGRTRIPARCAKGHDCKPLPNSVLRGGGICSTCAGKNPAVAEAAFRARMAELGATILGEYVNTTTRVRARCAAGHDCQPLPNSVQQGHGICLTCVGLESGGRGSELPDTDGRAGRDRAG